METEAYDRARAFDTETMKRQRQRIADQEQEIDELNKEVDKFRDLCRKLRKRIDILESGKNENASSGD